jgi:hypothetical protein
LALGKFPALARILAIQAALLIPAMVWGAYSDGAMGVVIATLIVGLVLAPINLSQVFRAIDLHYDAFLGVIWRPLVAAGVMCGVIALLHRSWVAESFVAKLEQAIVLGTLGALVYTVMILFLWKLASCPAGAEEYVLEKLKITNFVRRAIS